MGFYEDLKVCNGPLCKRCGCLDTTVRQKPRPEEWWPSGRARCNHCGMTFSFKYQAQEEESKPQVTLQPQPAAPEPMRFGPTTLPEMSFYEPDDLSTRIDVAADMAERYQEPEEVPVNPIKCPQCGAAAKAYSTKGRVQYRKCPKCGGKFKTLKEAG